MGEAGGGYQYPDSEEEAMRAEMADREQERLARASRCPQCGRSANGAEWDLLSHAQAMNAALRHIRWLAEAAGGSGGVPAERILEALDRPYRFPLPDGPDSR